MLVILIVVHLLVVAVVGIEFPQTAPLVVVQDVPVIVCVQIIVGIAPILGCWHMVYYITVITSRRGK